MKMYWIENIVMRFYLLGMYVINNLRCHYSILSQYLVFSLRIQARVHIYIFCFLSPSIPYTPTPSKNVEIYQRRSILLIKACTEKQRKQLDCVRKLLENGNKLLIDGKVWTEYLPFYLITGT